TAAAHGAAAKPHASTNSLAAPITSSGFQYAAPSDSAGSSTAVAPNVTAAAGRRRTARPRRPSSPPPSTPAASTRSARLAPTSADHQSNSAAPHGSPVDTGSGSWIQQ